MSQKIIRAAIESRLKTWADAQSPPIPVAWQNAAFTPPTQARYLRAFLLPAETIDHALTLDMHTRIGVYQVSVCVPDGSGAGAAETLSEDIIALFAQGTRLIQSGLTIEIPKSPYASPAMQEPGLFVIPVSIRYRAAVAQ